MSTDDTDDRECSDRLIARYGRPRHLMPDIPGEVLVFAHETREAAEAFAEGNRRYYGHPSEAQLREAVGWVSTVDLRPAIARIREEMGDQ